MTTPKTWHITSTSPNQTESLAAKLAGNLKGGEVIELISDLGGGKTTFVRGLVRGLDSTDTVNSPTFKISNVYRSPTLVINHFDLYRLPEPGLVSYELSEVMADDQSVTLIEWAEGATKVLPKKRLTIKFEPTSEHGRQITFYYPIDLTYLIKGLEE
jgi:tRNA threonylcarbamoyladenosine biosynthesis protein TsaE